MLDRIHLIGLFILFTIPCLGQKTILETDRMDDCHAIKLPYTTDSTKRRQDFDSVAASLVGEWQLVEINGNRHLPVRPAQPTKMRITPSRQGIIYENNVSVTTFSLYLYEAYNYVRFKVIQQKGKPFFSLPIESQRGLRLCDDILIMYDFYADGQGLAFERMH